MLKVRRQISVGWPGGGASAMVSPLLWCVCAINVDLLDYRWCKGTGLYDDAPDWRDARGLSLSWEFIIIKESNSPHQAMQSNIFTGGESLSSSGSGWCCFAYYGGFASILGWPAERFEHRQVNWRRGIFRTSPGHRFVSPCDQADGPCHRPFLWLPWFPRRDICGSTSRASRTKTALSSLMPPSRLPAYLATPLTLSPLGFGRQSAMRRRLWGFLSPAVLKSRERRPPGPDQDRFLWGVKHKGRVWRAEHPLVETGVRLAALHSPPQRDQTWGASSPPRKSPEACAPRTPGVCPPWEGREKFQQRIMTPSWHPQEAVVQSPSPLVSRGAAVSSEMLRVRLLPAHVSGHHTSNIPPSKRSVKTSAPFREAGSVEATAKYISVGRKDCRERLQDSVCISASVFQRRGLHFRETGTSAFVDTRVASSAGQRGHRTCSPARQRVRLLQPVFSGSQKGWGDWFVTIDLKDAYFHIEILPQHRKFLRFAFGGEAYQYRVLPFGLALSPRTYTKCMDAALTPGHPHFKLQRRLADSGTVSRACASCEHVRWYVW